MATTVDNLVLQYVTRGESSFRGSLSGVGGAIGSLENRMQGLGMAQNLVVAAGGYKVLSYIKQLGTDSINTAGMMQKTNAAFGALLHNKAEGAAEVNKLLKFSRDTPFGFEAVTHQAQTLKAMGFETKALIPTMHTLGDAVSALGGDSQVFQRVVYNLGQIKSQGHAYARDLMQFNMAGLDVVGTMAAATGKVFTQHQLTEMDGEEFIENFLKGIQIKFGGVMEKMMDTIPGQLHKLENSKMILKMDIGKAFTGEFMGGLKKEIELVDKLDNFIKNHPRVTKVAIGGAALGATGIVGTLALGAGAASLNNINQLLGRTTKAKGLLTAATKLDSAAELTKAGIAGKEGRAIGDVGLMAEKAARSKLGLTAATKEATAYSAIFEEKVGQMMAGGVSRGNAEKMAAESLARYGIVPEIETAATKLSKLDRLKNLLGRSISPAMSEVPQLQRQMIDPMGFYTTRGGKLAVRSQIFPTQAINRRIMAAAGEGEFTSGGLNTLKAFGGGGEALTYGGAAMGVGLGIGAGVQSYGNWKAIGDSTGEAMAKASVTGIGAGLVATFVPGGKIAVAAGEALAWGINKFVNEPMEKAATHDDRMDDTPEAQGMTAQQKSDYYKKKGMDELAKGPSFWQKIGNSAFVRDGGVGNYDNPEADRAFQQSQLFAQQAKQQDALAKKKADADAQAAADAKRAADDRNNAIYNTINNGAAFYGGASQSRNGAWTITIPQSAADKSHRKIKANNNMTPNFL